MGGGGAGVDPEAHAERSRRSLCCWWVRDTEEERDFSVVCPEVLESTIGLNRAIELWILDEYS